MLDFTRIYRLDLFSHFTTPYGVERQHHTVCLDFPFFYLVQRIAPVGMNPGVWATCFRLENL